jgi:hypothetical protein
MYSYDTVSEAINGLKDRGFVLDFNLSPDCLVCEETRLRPEAFEIVEVYRFEGDSDPADEAVVYGIEASDGRKGVLVNGYGISAEEMGSEMARKLELHRL